MGTFLSVFCIVVLAAFIEQKKNINYTRNKNLDFYFFSLLFILLITFRGQASADYETYVRLFLNTPSLMSFFQQDGVRRDPFFFLFASIIRTFTDNPLPFFALISGMSVCIRFNIFKKYSPLFSVALFPFLYVQFFKELGQIRHAFMMSLILLSLTFVAKRRPFSFLITALSATLIHSAGIICLIFYPLSKIRIRHNSFALAIYLFLFLIFSIFPFGTTFVIMISKVLSQLGLENISHSLFRYVGTEYSTGYFILSFGVLKTLLIISVSLLFSKQCDEQSLLFWPCLKAFMIGGLLMALFSDFWILVYRFSEICFTGESILISCLFASFSPWVRKILLIPYVMLSALLFFPNALLSASIFPW